MESPLFRDRRDDLEALIDQVDQNKLDQNGAVKRAQKFKTTSRHDEKKLSLLTSKI
jgi:hypothetical protein